MIDEGYSPCPYYRIGATELERTWTVQARAMFCGRRQLANDFGRRECDGLRMARGNLPDDGTTRRKHCGNTTWEECRSGRPSHGSITTADESFGNVTAATHFL